jgi:cytochrome P450
VDAAIDWARAGLRDYLTDLVAFRQGNPGSDLLSGLLGVHAGGDRITADEIVKLATLLLVAGHETTVSLIGNGVLALLRAPGQICSAVWAGSNWPEPRSGGLPSRCAAWRPCRWRRRADNGARSLYLVSTPSAVIEPGQIALP